MYFEFCYNCAVGMWIWPAISAWLKLFTLLHFFFFFFFFYMALWTSEGLKKDHMLYIYSTWHILFTLQLCIRYQFHLNVTAVIGPPTHQLLSMSHNSFPQLLSFYLIKYDYFKPSLEDDTVIGITVVVVPLVYLPYCCSISHHTA